MEIVESERERKWGLLEIVECKAFMKIMCINLRFIFSRTMIYLPFLLFIFSFLCALRLVVPSKPLSGFEHYNIMIKTRRGWHSKVYSVWILGQMRKLLITLRFVPCFHTNRALERGEKLKTQRTISLWRFFHPWRAIQCRNRMLNVLVAGKFSVYLCRFFSGC